MAKLGRKESSGEEIVDAHTLITPGEVEQIRQSLIEEHADLVVRGMMNTEVREKLVKIVMKDYRMVTKSNPHVVRYIVRETIGTGVIEEILQDESITDIGYNGSELIIETNDEKRIFDSNVEVTDNYIIRLVNKFANANDREFTSKNPIFDGRFENIRINAVHAQNTAPESGTTMALRVVRPRLALTDDNFGLFAPEFMKDFFKAAALGKANMVISGTTGTGKTELHKFISSYIPFNDRIILIEDTPETFMKEMFPEKDIFSWITNETVSVTDLIKAGLRSHPIWMMVTETRGQEAFEMIQAVLAGQSIITSLHTTAARAIPSRLVNMAKMGYDVDEESLTRDIRMYFDLGIHIKKVIFHGRVIRYLSEVIGFHPDGDLTIFRQRFVNGTFKVETFDLPEDFINRLTDEMVDIDAMNFPDNIQEERPLPESKTATYRTIIPTKKDDAEKTEGVMDKMNALKSRVFNTDKPEEGYTNEESEIIEHDNVAMAFTDTSEGEHVSTSEDAYQEDKPEDEYVERFEDATEDDQGAVSKLGGFKAKLFSKKVVENVVRSDVGTNEPDLSERDNGEETLARNISMNVADIIKSKKNNE